MSRKVIEIVQVLVDQIHQGGYTQRALEDDIYAESRKRIAAEKDRDHWRQARQEAHEAGELMKAEIETLRQQLANAQRELSEQGQAHSVELQRETAGLREQLTAAQAAVSLQRAGVERLQAFVEKIRDASWNTLRATAGLALAELDADTEPTPVAEPVDAEGGQ